MEAALRGEVVEMIAGEPRSHQQHKTSVEAALRGEVVEMIAGEPRSHQQRKTSVGAALCGDADLGKDRGMNPLPPAR
ncbi:hypothetical protein D0N37_14400 [Pseudoalteromonas piscicida]|nr:hypothetical protein D0N37_14400 [Pseudoalteromonas piscicida]